MEARTAERGRAPGLAPSLDARAKLRLEIWNANGLSADDRIAGAAVALPPLSVGPTHAGGSPEADHCVELDTGGVLLCRLYYSRNYFYE